MKEATFEQLAALLADVCGVPAGSLAPTSAPGTTPGWDSVTMLGFIAAVEDELAIAITTDEAMKIKTLGDVVQLVEAKRGR
jgi:acyl carrier protein